jgi:hypothetical protein
MSVGRSAANAAERNNGECKTFGTQGLVFAVIFSAVRPATTSMPGERIAPNFWPNQLVSERWSRCFGSSHLCVPAPCISIQIQIEQETMS